MRQFIVILLVYLSGVFPVFSQVRQCHADEHLAEEVRQNPSRLNILKQAERHTEQFGRSLASRSENLITIPVVVHIVYNDVAENISDDQVRSQIEVLNKDFRRKNTDTTSLWSVAADAGIEFCLATRDPAGLPTSGITRTPTLITSFATTGDNVKYSSKGGKDAWPADSYLNIWVCDITGSVLGYAQFPGGKPETDGVVVDYKVFGTGPNVTPGFHLGRTATHEVGHWLNLKHIWGSGDCVNDDLVADTPKAEGPNYGCQKGHWSCGSIDMVENYMDYSNDDCMNLFTAGQKTRMQALFSDGGLRSKIRESKGCLKVQNAECLRLKVTLALDNYPQETTWEIKDKSGLVVLKGGPYNSLQKNTTVTLDTCFAAGCYSFSVYDSYGDGMCCKYGSGKYQLSKGTTLIAEGGSFGKSVTHGFCLESSVPTCTDGIQNGDETGVDCGGSCEPCNTGSGGNAISGYYFEGGWDGWTGGPLDTERYKGDYSWEGDYSLMIRDNSGDESSVVSPEINLSGYSRALVQFSFFPYSMEKGEDFFVNYYNGASWQKVKAYVSETDFFNGNFYEASVTIEGFGTLSPKSRISFQCDASTNADQIYIDAVRISGLASSARTEFDKVLTVGQYLGPLDVSPEVKIYPNPASEEVHITSNVPIVSVRIMDMTGKVYTTIDGRDEFHLKSDIMELEPAIYLINVQTEGTIISRRLVRK